ncbi:MAG: ADP-ribosylglycohydrolase family protein, partial [Proteiniphilum sp.]|nr:ADP-ribosylglycohydrolase family protein [Proteiniphilum sp.]
MKRGIIVLPFLWVLICLLSCSKEKQSFAVISKTELNDKIKGAWAGKMIGVMKGIGMEFKAASVTYEDSIIWYPEMIERALLEDDIYGQLSFMSSMVRNQGLQTPVSKLAEDFANAEFNLCHANLQARKNFFDGIMPPLSGAPAYNMHANDIDFQIESDYIGFINPGMPRAATLMADSVGRIMAYGDGLYGGMFVSAMHALAFFEKDAKVVVKKALQAIPSESQYAKAIQTVIDGYEQDPSNWRSTWQILQDRWGESDLCVPYHPFNIDATINGAYIAMGLLY